MGEHGGQSKRRHAKMATNQNGDKDFMTLLDSQNGDKPKRIQSERWQLSRNGDNN